MKIPQVKRLYLKTMTDLIEASLGEHNILHIIRNKVHYYYIYGLYTAEWIVICIFKTDKVFKRYLHLAMAQDKQIIVESDIPPNRPCVCVIEVEKEPLI